MPSQAPHAQVGKAKAACLSSEIFRAISFIPSCKCATRTIPRYHFAMMLIGH
jgi:hypothetical protein